MEHKTVATAKAVFSLLPDPSVRGRETGRTDRKNEEGACENGTLALLQFEFNSLIHHKTCNLAGKLVTFFVF